MPIRFERSSVYDDRRKKKTSMRIVFISNFMNHHQLPLCEEFVKMDGVEFTFIATTPIPSSRTKIGYSNMNGYNFVLRAYESKENQRKAKLYIQAADVFINGDNVRYTKLRLKAKKPAYVVSERYFRDFGISYRKTKAFKLASWFYHVFPFRNKDVRYFASSAYLAKDIASFGQAKNPVYKWGYFIDPSKFVTSRTGTLNSPISILWLGRFLDWKHPDIAIDVVNGLKKRGIATQLTMVGNGPGRDKLIAKEKEFGLEKTVNFIESIQQTKVSEAYAKADIFLFTSDYNEGWGAVLGEALSSGCLCFASVQAGSTPFLIQNGYNGFTFNPSNPLELEEGIASLLNMDRSDLAELQNNAMKSMQQVWSPKNAAYRLLVLDEALKRGESAPFLSGPCSKAEVLNEAQR